MPINARLGRTEQLAGLPSSHSTPRLQSAGCVAPRVVPGQ